MAAGWSTVVVCIGCAAAGYFARDWQFERSARIEAERQLVVAQQQPVATVDAERRLNAASEQRDRGKERARVVVDAAPSLADCKLPDDLAVLLATQLQATRASTGSGAVSNRPVP